MAKSRKRSVAAKRGALKRKGMSARLVNKITGKRKR